jgi:XRE family transcriptional regulator, regulator of sulfur utilization
MGVADERLDDALRDEIRAERQDTLAGPDGPEAHALAATIGASLRVLRSARGVPLAALADRTGLTEDDLGRLERGEALPNLRLVWTLATALAVPFGSLLADTTAEPAAFWVGRVGFGRLLVSADGRFRSRPLSPAGHANAPEVYELTLAPGCVEPADPHAPGTFEHLTVVRGVLIVDAGVEHARLEAGDALLFRADVPHRYENPTADQTVAHLVMRYARSDA